MSDTPDLVTTEAGRRWALIFGGTTLVFCLGLIVLVLLYGKPDNSLHASGLAWAFSMVGVVLAGLGFGAALQLLGPVLAKK